MVKLLNLIFWLFRVVSRSGGRRFLGSWEGVSGVFLVGAHGNCCGGAIAPCALWLETSGSHVEQKSKW